MRSAHLKVYTCFVLGALAFHCADTLALSLKGTLAEDDGTPLPDGTYAARVVVHDVALDEEVLTIDVLVPQKNGAYALELPQFSLRSEGRYDVAIELSNNGAPAGRLVDQEGRPLPDGRYPVRVEILERESYEQVVSVDLVVDQCDGAYELRLPSLNLLSEAYLTRVALAGERLGEDSVSQDGVGDDDTGRQKARRRAKKTWKTKGNKWIDPEKNFLGTVDFSPVAFRTVNDERMRITEAGNVGIGTSAPAVKLDVVSGSIRTDQQLISNAPSGTAPLSVWSSTWVENLNADLLDDREGADYLNAGNINAGTLSTDRFSARSDLVAEGHLNNDNDNDLVTRSQADARFVNEGQANSVTGAMISDGAVGSADIADNTLTAADLAPNSVGSSELAPNAVDGAGIKDGAVGSADIADNTLTTADLASNSVGSSELAPNAVDTAAIQDHAVTAAKLADGAIGSADVADNTLTAADLAPNSVGASELAPNAVDTAAVQDHAVTAAKLADGAALAEIADDAGAGSGLDADLLDGKQATGFAAATHDHLGEQWSGAPGTGLGVATSNAAGTALRGRATAASGVGIGVEGESAAGSGIGVRGYATASGLAHDTIGVTGETDSPKGIGVVGYARATGAAQSPPYPIGVHGRTSSPTGVAGLFDNDGGGAILLGRVQGTNQFRVDAAGKVFANGGFQASGADFAESMPVVGNVSDYEPGDVLVISRTHPGRVEKCTEARSTRVIGVYATKPGLLGTTKPIDGDLSKEIPVGIVGIVPCKVDASYGAIEPGDLLTCSPTVGHAMRYSESTDGDIPRVGAVLGKALGRRKHGRGRMQVALCRN